MNRLGKNEYFKLFLICSFPVHVWAYLSLLDILPATLLQMSLGSILGVAAYVLDFALLESLFVFGIIFLATLILPKRLFNLEIFQVLAIFIFATSLAAWLIHLYNKWEIDFLSFSNWIALWILVGTSAFALAVNQLSRNQRNQELFRSAIERLAILSMVYLSLDIVGLFVILIRNSGAFS
jgi:hypothetical protein